MIAISPANRHRLVVAGAVGAIVIGLLAIRGAALFARSSAPLDVAPVSVSSLEQALVVEQDRSAALAAELAVLTEQSAGLKAAMEAATSQVGEDAANARALQTKLRAAEQKLARLQASITATGTSQRPAVAAASAERSGGRGNDEEDHDDDDD